MRYNFLRDEAELRAFGDEILPDLSEGESFVLLLCVRRKYLQGEVVDVDRGLTRTL